MPGTATDGTREYFKTPEPTPELIEWSDWCFFEVPHISFTDAYDCAGVYSSMAVALELLGMDQQCVLAQSRTLIDALTSVGGGLRRAQAKSNNGWHLCPSAADPDPADGRSLTQRCASVPELVEWMDSRYEGGCAQWAHEQQQLFETMLTHPRESRCVLAHSLLNTWVLAVQGATIRLPVAPAEAQSRIRTQRALSPIHARAYRHDVNSCENRDPVHGCSRRS